MTTVTTPASTIIPTPIEILIPLPCEDHGLELVHDMSGQPRNYLHQVSVVAGSEADAYCRDAGYRFSSGYPRGWVQMKVYTKEFPLYVGDW